MDRGGPADRAAPSALRILSTLAVQGAMPVIAADWPGKLDLSYAPTLELLRRLRGGEAADVAILTREGVDELADAGLIAEGTIVDLALSHVGIAVQAGRTVPVIDTAEAVRTALLDAASVCYSQSGASGLFFAGLIERMGIAEAVNAKARIIPTGFTAEPVARGEADLAIQQISELMAVPGVTIAGRLPRALQRPTMFSAGVLRASDRQAEAAALVIHLGSANAAAAFARAGLEPLDASASGPDLSR